MKYLIILTLLILSQGACVNKVTKHINTPMQEQNLSCSTRKICNSIYFWKTTFKLSDEERIFLADKKIERLYLRYFDVYLDPDTQNSPAPNATIRFSDPIPENLEIIPTVFIDNELFKYCNMSSYPQRLVERIRVMSETNDIQNIKEIQLDCDWTQTTEESFFDFLENIRKELAKHRIRLSATIRLHQLRMKTPPVDRGVLMCYNTGAIRNSETVNSILSVIDIIPYAKNLKNYNLPLDIAYPIFSWSVWYRDNQFVALLRNVNPENTNLVNKEANKYIVKDGFYQEGHYLAVDDQIRFEFSDYNEIINVKRLLEPQLNNFSIILYHLDTKNLSKYTNHEINQIYSY